MEESKATISTHFLPPSVRHNTWTELLAKLQHLAFSPEELDRDTIKNEIDELIKILKITEKYCAYPGKKCVNEIVQFIDDGAIASVLKLVEHLVDVLESGDYRRLAITSEVPDAPLSTLYFEVLIVASISEAEEDQLSQNLAEWRSAQDQFLYKIVVVNNFEEAQTALLLNVNIQAVVIHDNFTLRGEIDLPKNLCHHHNVRCIEEEIRGSKETFLLAEVLHQLRPSVNLFLSTYIFQEAFPGNYHHQFSRIFHRYESFSDLHLSLLRAIASRYYAPFFEAVETYARRPVGAFHALPISRGNSVLNSPWTRDFCEFYGNKIFLGESSATSDGLESLINPHETILSAQAKAAECFGAKQSYFVTNGTTMSNKVVHQAITQPGDIVLIDRSCHESQHFAFIISGASPHYLKHYSLNEYSIAGGIPLKEIKEALLNLKEKGLLHRVKMLALTNCTFDGFIYNVRRVMEEVLAIKPDLVIFWDEAWFAFARFLPHYRQRTAMYNADLLACELRSDRYRKEYAKYKKTFLSKHPEFDKNWIKQRLMPDPDQAKIRVYATQSTHKTLSSFRQGSMIHVYDEHFNRHARHRLRLAFLTHTTSSPNYQILSSLDVARRQASIEGYELASRQVELARTIRDTIKTHPLLKRYFKVLTESALVPSEYREIKRTKDNDWECIAAQWQDNEFVLDPCRITLCIAGIGVDGATFKKKYLAERYGIQVNKTGFNTVCLMTNIGTTRSATSYLIESLIEIAQEIEQERQCSHESAEFIKKHVKSVTETPPLPQFSTFFHSYQMQKDVDVGDIRSAYFDGCVDENVEHIMQDELKERLLNNEVLVSAAFVIPYPPGYPLLVPGQILNFETWEYLDRLHVREILGFDPNIGARFFTQDFLSFNDTT